MPVICNYLMIKVEENGMIFGELFTRCLAVGQVPFF